MNPTIALILLFISTSCFAVYGEDTRVEYFQIKDHKIKQQASAIAYQVERHYELRGWTFNRLWELVMRPFEEQKICPDQRFVDQLSLRKNCTGILVSPKHILTGGNCITEHYCKNDLYYWMFDYNLKDIDVFSVKRPRKNFYKCKKVIKRAYHPQRRRSYALIELKKKVKGIQPAQFNLNSELNEENPLVVLGHMRGLPLKADIGSKVISRDNKNFLVNSDLPGKYSVGSAVLNKKSGLVEGFIAGGEGGYEIDPRGCWREDYFSNNEGYEYVIHLETIKDILSSLH